MYIVQHLKRRNSADSLTKPTSQYFHRKKTENLSALLINQIFNLG